MLWHLVLPTRITFYALVTVVVVLIVAAPKLGWKRNRALLFGPIAAMLAIVPSCASVKYVLDQYRFGVFEYANHQAINDRRIQLYLPEPAQEILIHQHVQKFQAKFKINKPALDKWIDQQWRQYGEQSVVSREEPENSLSEHFHHWFRGLNWPPLPEAKFYSGPRAPKGAGFMLWYSESTETAYQYFGYW